MLPLRIFQGFFASHGTRHDVTPNPTPVLNPNQKGIKGQTC